MNHIYKSTDYIFNSIYNISVFVDGSDLSDLCDFVSVHCFLLKIKAQKVIKHGNIVD